MLLSENIVTQFFPCLSTERRLGAAGEQEMDERDKTPPPPGLVAPARPQAESFALHSTSASWTLATKVSDSHLSISDHDFLSFRLFLSPYVTLDFLLNVTTTFSA